MNSSIVKINRNKFDILNNICSSFNDLKESYTKNAYCSICGPNNNNENSGGPLTSQVMYKIVNQCQAPPPLLCKNNLKLMLTCNLIIGEYTLQIHLTKFLIGHFVNSFFADQALIIWKRIFA